MDRRSKDRQKGEGKQMELNKVIEQCKIEAVKQKEWETLYEQIIGWLKELQEYRSIGPTPDQLKQINHLYTEQAKKLQDYESQKQEGKILIDQSAFYDIEEFDDLISKKEIMSHIGSRIYNEYGQCDEDYDAEQILGDIEDFPTVTVRIFQQLKVIKKKSEEQVSESSSKNL